MTHLKVEQNTGTIELVDRSVIAELYELLAYNVLDSSSNLLGRIHTSATYLEYIDYIRAKYPDLYITSDKIYIKFADSEIENVLKTTIGDGIGVSVQDADKAILTSSTFSGNTTITSFNEFPYFTRANTNPPNDLFYNCTNLTLIDLSETTTLGNNEFRNSGLTDVNAPNLALFAGEFLFYECGSLTSVSSLGNVVSIPKLCFIRCRNLESVTLPASCTTLGVQAFLNNTSLSSINLNNLTVIMDGALQGCSLLTINIADILNCTTIGGYAFSNTLRINGEVNLPKLTSCGNGIFRETSGVTKATCLGKITSIPADMFMNSKDGNALKEVYIPYECTSIKQKAFLNNRGLTTIKQYTASIDDWVEGLEPTYTDLYRVTALEQYAFSGCLSLTEIKLGNVTMVPENCFADCSSLSSINIKLENLTDILSGAFSRSPINWGVLRYLGLYFSKKTYRDNLDASSAGGMFIGNTFKQLYLPNLKAGYGSGEYSNYHSCATFLGTLYSGPAPTYGLIYMRNIESLFPATFNGANITSLVINNTTVPICRNTYNASTASSNAMSKDLVFANFPATAKVYVPDSAVAAYKAADVWSTIASLIYPMSSLTRYATEAAWVAAGESNTALIEEYM